MKRAMKILLIVVMITVLLLIIGIFMISFKKITVTLTKTYIHKDNYVSFYFDEAYFFSGNRILFLNSKNKRIDPIEFKKGDKVEVFYIIPIVVQSVGCVGYTKIEEVLVVKKVE